MTERYCKLCDGSGSIRTGIAEASESSCLACEGTGYERATPADHIGDAAEKVDAGSVPVAWQYRYRKTIGSVPLMSDWRECSEKDAKSYMADFEYGPDSLEVRALSVIAAPQPPQSEAQSVRDATIEGLLHRLNDATRPIDAADRNILIRILKSSTLKESF